MKGEKPPIINKVTFLMLSNDLLLNCLARVSRLYYPTLSLVCKSFRSLLASLELYQTRALLGRTENCLYMCLQFDFLNQTWFTLGRRPIQISDPNPNSRWSASCFALYRFLKNFTRNQEKKFSENFFVSVPTRNSPFITIHNLATVGYNIYNIGVYICGLPTAKVLFMDCRSHTWHEAPSMQIARSFPKTTVLDGKIYVVGGNKDCDYSNWIEFFDPETQVWEYVPSPYGEIDNFFKSLAIDGNLYLLGNKSVVYKPKENTWDEVDIPKMCFGLVFESFCVTDNIFYCLGLSGKLEWYDFEKESWRVLKGLEKLPELPPRHYNRLRMVDYGENIAVLWENEVGEGKEIWCAEISLERRNGREIRGKIEWCNVVLTVPKSCEFLQFLSVNV